ncbi:MAG: glycosyltransferase [Candidatus Kerfeldbacteria bacterium]|nr:glycosyltransferase [Candidatus Kerfeldbacteria bacterium]
MRVALVHDHLAQDGGAELVLRVLQELYPDAPTFTLVYDERHANPAFRGKDIRTSFLQSLPLGRRKYQWFLSLMPIAVESYDVMDYDVVISSTASFAKGVITRPDTLHLCYCHTPTRYLWSDTHSYLQEFPTNRVIKSILPLFLSRIRQWDRLAADRVDTFVANSKPVQRRIAKYYRRDSTVIYPPVDTSRFAIASHPESYYLMGGRLVPYKRFDLSIRAFNKLGIPLKIFGVGPEYTFLKNLAAKNVELLGKVSEEDRATLYARAVGFINPQEEDFGITAIESMASGRPVIAYGRGGALETVIEGVTGTFFHQPTWESLADAIIRFQPERFSPPAIREHALRFDTQRFQERFQSFVSTTWESFRKDHDL